jgi:hypothetical protein
LPDPPEAATADPRAPGLTVAPEVRTVPPWRYVQSGRRDLRLDFLRGFAAFAMVVDHLGGASFLYPITGGNLFFVSAAEAFIFLSGLLVGLIYGPRVVRDGLAVVQMHLLRRALTLYGVTLGLTFTFVGLSRLSGMPWLQDVAPLTPELVVSLITLHHTYYLVDVMLLYTILLAISPIPLLLLHTGNTRVVVLFTAGLWLLYQWFPGAATIPWEIVNNDVFNVSAWQIWFFGGMIIGYHRDRLWTALSRLPVWPAVLVLGTTAALLIVLRLVTLQPGGAGELPLIDALFDKHYARPGRVVAFAIFIPLFYLILTYFWRPLGRASGWLLLPFGQNALYVYAMHLFAIYLSALILPYVGLYDRFNPWINTPYQIAVVLAIWLLVKREVLFDIIPR